MLFHNFKKSSPIIDGGNLKKNTHSSAYKKKLQVSDTRRILNLADGRRERGLAVIYVANCTNLQQAMGKKLRQ